MPSQKEFRRVLSSGIRCLQILRVLANVSEDLSLQQIAASASLPPSTTHRMLATLVAEGFVEQADDHRYRLGLEAFMIGAGFLRRSMLRRTSIPVLVRLAEQTGASVNLAVWDAGRVVMLDCLPAIGMYHYYNEPGCVVAPHATALGKCLLAFSGGQALKQIGSLHRYTEKTICTMAEFKRELQRIRKLGYAVDDEEYLSGARCVAVPVLQSEGAPLAAISVSAPATTLEIRKISKLVALMKEASLSISMQLGFRPVPLRRRSRA